MHPLSNSTILITGCASGMGRHLAGALVQRGAKIIATDVHLEAVEKDCDEKGWPEDRVLVRKLDVRDPDEWEAVVKEGVERFGRLHVVLNVAGYLLPGWCHEFKREDVHRHFDINVKGVVFGTQAAAKVMMAQGSGHIINIASMASLAPIPGLCLYSASKYAVRSFSLAAAHELREHGVFVTTVCPDAVATPMFELQKPYPEAALTFSVPGVMTVEYIEKVLVEKILPRRPVIIVLPRWRGWMARVGDWFPGSARFLAPVLQAYGRRRQMLLSR